MADVIALKYASGRLRQFAETDVILVDGLDRRSASGNIVLGASLGAAEELQLASTTSTVRILGDFIVDGSSTVSVDETVSGEFSCEGDVNLGNNDGDVILLGGGTSDTVQLLADLVVGAGLVHIGSSTSDYLAELWLVAVNDNGPDLAAYNLAASGTNAGAYSIGVNPALLDNASATDLMTTLDQLDAAITSAASPDTLQSAYAAGNTIAVTSGNGTVGLSNDTDSDTTDVLTVSRAPSTSTAGEGVVVTMGANCTGNAVDITNSGSGSALKVTDGASAVLDITGTGAFNVTAQATSSIATATGDLTVQAAGELTFNDTGGSSIELSQSADRTLDETGAGEVLEGATSVIGAINRLARGITSSGAQATDAIENGVTITAGDVVAQSTTSGRVTQANCNADTNARILGIAITGGTGDAGGSVTCTYALPTSEVTIAGASYTPGGMLFAPDGTGAPTQTAPSTVGDVVAPLGYAATATTFKLQLGTACIL
jgi:hypothetical protein